MSLTFTEQEADRNARLGRLDAAPAGMATDFAAERAERNRIAKECAEHRQRADELAAQLARAMPVVHAAIAEDDAEEYADRPVLDRFAVDKLNEAHERRRAAVVAYRAGANGHPDSWRVQSLLSEVGAELAAAIDAFPDMASSHEGYAIIREEIDELWDEIKGNKRPGSRDRQRVEAIQSAAMCLRLVLDVLDAA